MKQNFANLVKAEIVKRFEDLTKQQISDYEDLVKTHQSSLMALSNIVNSFKEDFKKVEKSSLDLKNEILKKIEEHKESLEFSFAAYRKAVDTNIKEMVALYNEIQKNNSKLATKEENENLLNDFKAIASESGNTFNLHLKNSNETTRELIEAVKRQHEIEKTSIGNLLIAHENKFEELNKKLELYRIETESARKEFKIFDKTVFIMEKKIENIYTLIERLQKRLEDVPTRLS